MNKPNAISTPHDPSRPAATSNVPAQIVVKLNPAERAALAAVIETLKTPNRRSPTISECVRAAILATAAQAE